MISAFRQWSAAAAGLLYPALCVECETPLPAGAYLCDGCKERAQPIQPPYCERCSQPFHGSIDGAFTCAECAGRDFALIAR